MAKKVNYGMMALIGLGGYLIYDHLTKVAAIPEAASPTAVPPSTVTPPASGPRFVQVGQGDTMGKIASAYSLTLEQLAMLNPAFGPKGNRSMNLIYPGEEIRVA